MRYQLGLEDIERDHWVAWVFAYPGVYGSGPTPQAAVAAAPARVAAERAARGQPEQPVEVEVVEKLHGYVGEVDEDGDAYVVNAFFADDRRPLRQAEIADGLAFLGRTRHGLLAVLRTLTPEDLTRPRAGEARGSIEGILRHVAVAEWWYLDRLGLAFSRERLPDDPLAALAEVRAWTRARLPELTGDGRVTERRGERWSARKVLRRALWHEQDHTQHIAKLIAAQPVADG